MKDLKYIVISSSKQVKKYIIDLNPPRQLVKLLREGCDGGKGEFEELLPAILSDNNDASFMPTLEKGVVIWERIF